jgi:hypothetical protein
MNEDLLTVFKLALPDPRCVMRTVAQGDIPDDTDVLRALVRHNKLQVGELGDSIVDVDAVVVRGTVMTGGRGLN